MMDGRSKASCQETHQAKDGMLESRGKARGERVTAASCVGGYVRICHQPVDSTYAVQLVHREDIFSKFCILFSTEKSINQRRSYLGQERPRPRLLQGQTILKLHCCQ